MRLNTKSPLPVNQEITSELGRSLSTVALGKNDRRGTGDWRTRKEGRNDGGMGMACDFIHDGQGHNSTSFASIIGFG